MLLSKSTQSSLWSFTLNIFSYFQQKRTANFPSHAWLTSCLGEDCFNTCEHVHYKRQTCSFLHQNLSSEYFSGNLTHRELAQNAFLSLKEKRSWLRQHHCDRLRTSSTWLRSEREKWNQGLLQQISSYVSFPFPIPNCIVLIWKHDLFLKYLVGGRGGEQSFTKLPRAADRGK